MRKTKIKNVAVQLSISEIHRNLLKKIVAERMVSEPEKNITMTGICREIICTKLEEYQDKLNS